MPRSAGIAGTVNESGQVLTINNPYADARFDQAMDRASGYTTTSILCVRVAPVETTKAVAPCNPGGGFSQQLRPALDQHAQFDRFRPRRRCQFRSAREHHPVGGCCRRSTSWVEVASPRKTCGESASQLYASRKVQAILSPGGLIVRLMSRMDASVGHGRVGQCIVTCSFEMVSLARILCKVASAAALTLRNAASYEEMAHDVQECNVRRN
jgi:hypothetical protein